MRWKRQPTKAPSSSPSRTSSQTMTSSSSSTAHSISVAPISPAASTVSQAGSATASALVPAESISDTAIATTTAESDSGDAVAHDHQPRAAWNTTLKFEIDISTSTNSNRSADQQQVAPLGSPGCFSLCGWTKYKIKSPVNPTTSASSPKSVAVQPPSPVGSAPHCYAGAASSCANVKQLASPARRTGVLGSLPTFRKYTICAQCKASMSAGDNDRKVATDPSIQPNAGKAKEREAEAAQCLVCSKVSAFEAQLAKAFFCPGHVDGKSVRYAGLPAACYRKWFKERPMTPESVRKTHAKRAAMLTTLQKQHKLHYHKLKDVCLELCVAFGAATCFFSLADKELELILGNYGSMLHFSCFPREIGMCDYAMGTTEQHLCIRSVPDDPVFRENPMLQAVKAQFYFGIPVLVDGIAIGAIAVMDVNPRIEPLDPVALGMMRQKADMMGSRVSALLSGSPSSFATGVMKRRSR